MAMKKKVRSRVFMKSAGWTYFVRVASCSGSPNDFPAGLHILLGKLKPDASRAASDENSLAGHCCCWLLVVWRLICSLAGKKSTDGWIKVIEVRNPGGGKKVVVVNAVVFA